MTKSSVIKEVFKVTHIPQFKKNVYSPQLFLKRAINLYQQPFVYLKKKKNNGVDIIHNLIA